MLTTERFFHLFCKVFKCYECDLLWTEAKLPVVLGAAAVVPS